MYDSITGQIVHLNNHSKYKIKINLPSCEINELTALISLFVAKDCYVTKAQSSSRTKGKIRENLGVK